MNIFLRYFVVFFFSPISYNKRLVSETLNWLLEEALKYYPQHIAWLKIKGDLELG